MSNSMHDIMRNRILEKAGVSQKTNSPPQELFHTEWDDSFERMRREHMIMGAYRYGKLGDRMDLGYNYIKGIRDRLNEYEKTRNMEHLLDIGNFAMVLWMKDDNPKCHMRTIDTEKTEHHLK